MQSYRSARFVFGWINRVDANGFGVEFIQREVGNLGGKYHVELNDGLNLLMADAILVSCDGEHGTLVIDGPVRMTRQTMGLRLKATFDAEIVVSGEKHNARVVDLSDDGMGLLANVALSRTKYVQVNAVLDQGPLSVVGRVVYSREIVDGKWAYRIGLYIPQLNQLIDPEDGDLRRVHLDPGRAA